MSADNPASSGDSDQPDSGQPDRGPERTPPPERPAASADTGQSGSNRSRAEYAATLRNAGWDSPSQSASASTEHTQPAQAADSRTSPGENEPSRHEQAGPPDTRHQPRADDPPPTAETPPSGARDSEPATRQPAHDAPAPSSDRMEPRGAGGDTPDSPPPDDTGNIGQPADTEAADPAADQPSRAGYATSLRLDDAWSANPDTASDRADQPAPEHQAPGDPSSGDQESAHPAHDQLPIAGQPTDVTEATANADEEASAGQTGELTDPDTADRTDTSIPGDQPSTDIPPADQETPHAAEDRPPIADQPTNVTEDTAKAHEDTSSGDDAELDDSDTAITSENTDQPPAPGNASTPDAATADHQTDELTYAEPGVAPEAPGTADPGIDAEAGRPDDAGPPPEDAGTQVPPETGQRTTLEAERDEASQQIADLKAENARQTALIDQLLASTDRAQGGEPSTPDHGADEPDTSPDLEAKRPSITERTATAQQADTNYDVPAWWRRAPSAEDVGAVSTVLGAADMAMHGMPGIAVAVGATIIGGASWLQAKIEKRRKGKT